MKLKELRVSYNLSQRQLSIKSGVNIETIRALEQGKNKSMKSITLEKLKKVFGNDVLKLI